MKLDRKKIIMQIIILVICIAINIAGRFAGELLKLPVWFDCVGTYISAFFAYPVVTIFVAVISQIFAGITNPVSLLYTITAVVVALAFIYCKKKGYMDSFIKMFISSFWIGLACVVVSTPLNIIFYEGYSGNMWGDALVDMFAWYELSPIVGSAAGELMVEIVDKQLCVIFGYLLTKGVIKLKERKNCASASKILSAFIAPVILVSLLLPQFTAFADNSSHGKGSNYVSTVYNNTTGMMSSEANAIAETEDGCIWIGSYAGLTRYNGIEFEFIRDGGIVNVTAMFCDSRGRLWVGTNDSGIARYENGEFTFFNAKNGLASNSVRSFAEDENGNVYVGTTDRICRFDETDTITAVNESVKYVVSIETAGNKLAAVDHNGNLYLLRGEEILMEFLSKDTDVFYQCVSKTAKGILLGTSGDTLYRLVLSENGGKTEETPYRVLDSVCEIEEDAKGHVWICAANGFGYVDSTGVFYDITEEGFDVSFEYIMEDYQGNIWLTSSRYGVLKLSESRFSNLFDKTGIENAVTNAVTEYNGRYYCGTDNGLVITEKDGTPVSNQLTKRLYDDRIRCLMVDSSNRLWISTYGSEGLVRYDTSGKIECFNVAEKNTTSDRFRCTIELKDGTVVAGTADGINFIKGDEVVDTITAAEDNLLNAQILSLAADEDGTIYAGSDGGGINIIRDGEVKEIYTTGKGLSSNVILRIVPFENGHFIVTSNSLCYMENRRIKQLKNFPYFNNYDIIIKGEKAYVLSSAGIYVANAKEMAADGDYRYELLSSGDGLFAGLTANSWNYTDENGRLFLCSNSGTIIYDEALGKDGTDYRFGIASMYCDGQRVEEQNGVFTIPLNTKHITMKASVQNYALQNITAKFFVEGMDDSMEAVSYHNLEPIQVSNLIHGTYNVRLQIFDSSGAQLLQEKTYRLEKEMPIWETPWYRAYLVFVCIELVVFATWTVINMSTSAKKTRQLEAIRKELEEKVQVQIGQIKEQEEKEIQMFRKMIVALSDTVDAKDRYTSGHSRRVAEYSKMIAVRMGKSEEEQEEIYYSGLLHDVGKIRVPEDIINKAGKLTDEEFEMIKIHPVTSYRILKDISENSLIAIGAKFHHERYDGRGYPNGLSGTNIPEIARIIGVADSYDAMASNRSYRKSLPQEVVRGEIVKGKGTQFDPDIADIMLQMMDEDTDYMMKENDISNRTILAVDDDSVNLQMIKQIFRDEPNYHVLCIKNGEAALQLVEMQKVDLVLLDIEMPEMDGFEVLERVRKISNVPVVFTTADREISTIRRAAELGVDDYLTKPFVPATMKEVVHSVLRL